MRTLVVTLGISLLASIAPAAQTPDSQQSLLPTHRPRVRVDFGLVQARKKLLPVNPAPAVDCKMVKTHRHESLSVAMPTIKPPSNVQHHLKVVPVTPCPAR